MNIHELVDRATMDIKTKLEIATGQKFALLMVALPLSVDGQPEGLFTVATFEPSVQTIMPVIQGLVVAVAKKGAPINGGH